MSCWGHACLPLPEYKLLGMERAKCCSILIHIFVHVRMPRENSLGFPHYLPVAKNRQVAASLCSLNSAGDGTMKLFFVLGDPSLFPRENVLHLSCWKYHATFSNSLLRLMPFTHCGKNISQAILEQAQGPQFPKWTTRDASRMPRSRR